tara:strand:+ start:110 stop:451 length:342 start_codon:yes stop_codon:yes gene_type:complete
MENREITIEELQSGDEIITLTQQGKYLKVLETPRKSKVAYKWRTGVDRYISVRCKVNVDITPKQGSKYDHKTKSSIPYTYEVKEYNIKAPEDNSPIEKFDLNFKKLWLVKREI